MIRAAVIGVGRIGKEHARIYASLPDVELVGVCDLDQDRGQRLAAQYGVEFFSEYESLLHKVDVASIAVPTEDHCTIASDFMNHRVSVLVEKPMAVSLEEADRMIRLADENRVTLQIGHLERFNPMVRRISEAVTTPRFFEVHRLGEFTERSLDIDVVLDLMIHDLDIILWLVKSPVVEIRAVGIPILTPKIDIANARLTFASGCVANVTASRISRDKIRKLRLFQPGAYISLDYTEQAAEVYRLAAAVEPGGRPSIINSNLTLPRYEPLRAQIESFVECVKEKMPPLVSGQDGRAALDLALKITAKIQEHARREKIS